MGIYSNLEVLVYDALIDGQNQGKLTTNPDGSFTLRDSYSNPAPLKIKNAQTSDEAVTLGQVLGLVTTGSSVALGTASTKDIEFFATAAQGLKADTALQPQDNVSLLINDSGYLTRSAADGLYSTSTLNSHSISITGDGTWTVDFDGSSNVTSNLTLSTTGVTAGTYNSSGNSISPMVIDSKGRVQQMLDEIPITVNWDSINLTPSTLLGYGITDAQKKITGASSTVLYDNLTPNMFLVSDISGKISASTVSVTSLGYISNLTAPVQTQLDEKEPSIIAGTSTQYYRGDKSWATLNKSAVGLSLVENTALSTWSGSTLLTTAGDLTCSSISIPKCKTITMNINTTDTFQQLVGTFDSTLYRTAKILIQVRSNNDYHSTELLTIHNGTSVNITEYGITNTGYVLAIFDMEVLAGNVRLLATPLVTPLEITAVCTLISAT